jgi:hypothetical protein
MCEIPKRTSLQTINIHLKNERQKVKQILSGERISVGRWRVNGEGEEGQIWWMYFVYVNENRITKLVEIVPRRGRRGDEQE